MWINNLSALRTGSSQKDLTAAGRAEMKLAESDCSQLLFPGSCLAYGLVERNVATEGH